MCGEQFNICTLPHLPCGSPPRVRGTDERKIRRDVCRGITPACAGNRDQARRAKDLNRDHPRVCGEQSGSVFHAFRSLGSPPRVRGTDLVSIPPYEIKGITPACAGNRAATARRAERSKDHPRVCGEQACILYANVCFLGSPPRVRGTGRAVCEAVQRMGITPACAGNSHG